MQSLNGVPFSDFGGVANFDPNSGQGTDNTNALQAAINSGQKVYFPAGRYLIAGSVQGIEHSVNFEGAGFGLTEFYCTDQSGQAIIRNAVSNPASVVKITDIDLIAWGSGKTERAFELYFPENPSNTNTPQVLLNVRMRSPQGVGNFGRSWKSGIKLINAWKPIISGSFAGSADFANPGGFSDGSSIIYLDGGPTASLILTLKDFDGYYAQYGIYQNTYAESISMRGSEFVAVNKGIYNNPNYSGGGGSPIAVKGGTVWLDIGTHIAAIERCLDLTGFYYVFGNANLQRWAGGGTPNFEACRFTDCQGGRLIGDSFQGNLNESLFPGLTATGIVMTGSTNGFAIEVSMTNFTTSVVDVATGGANYYRLHPLFSGQAGNLGNANISNPNSRFEFYQADGQIARNRAP